MDQIIAKTGENINDWAAQSLEFFYLKLGDNQGNQDVIRGEILAIKRLLGVLGYHAELKIEIREQKE